MLHSAYNFLPQGHITDVQRLRTNFLPLNNRFSPVLSVYRCHGGKYTTNHQPKFLTREGPSYHLGNSWQSCSLNSLKIISPLEILVHPIFGKSLFQKWIIANIYLCLPRARNCSKHPLYINSFNYHTNPMRWALFLCPFCMWGN